MNRNVSAQFATLGLSVLMCGIALPAQVVSPEVTCAPTLRTKVEPKYTEEAFQAGITGKAVLFLKVDRNGVPTQVRLIKWSGITAGEINRVGAAAAEISGRHAVEAALNARCCHQ